MPDPEPAVPVAGVDATVVIPGVGTLVYVAGLLTGLTVAPPTEPAECPPGCPFRGVSVNLAGVGGPLQFVGQPQKQIYVANVPPP